MPLRLQTHHDRILLLSHTISTPARRRQTFHMAASNHGHSSQTPTLGM